MRSAWFFALTCLWLAARVSLAQPAPPVTDDPAGSPAIVEANPAAAPEPTPQPEVAAPVEETIITVTPTAEPEPQPEPEPVTQPAEDADPEDAPERHRSGANSFLRINPLAFALVGSPGGASSVWQPDLVSLGFGWQKLEFAMSVTAVNPFPGSDAFGVYYGRASAMYHPIRPPAGLPVVDFVVYGGLGLGGAGNWVEADGCKTECGRHYARTGGDIHAGVAIDVNIELFSFPSGQTTWLFFGLDFRPTLFMNATEAKFFDGYFVLSAPIGLRWD